MSPVEVLKVRAQVHADQANRLLQHPLVAEYGHHLRELHALQQEILKHAAENPPCEPTTDTPVPEGIERLPASNDRTGDARVKVHAPAELDS